MKIKVNGKEIDFQGNTLLDLINYYDLKPASIAIEKNRAIIRRDFYENEQINEGDVIELVRFVGGG